MIDQYGYDLIKWSRPGWDDRQRDIDRDLYRARRLLEELTTQLTSIQRAAAGWDPDTFTLAFGCLGGLKYLNRERVADA